MKFTIITRYYHPTPDGIAHHSAYLYQYLIALGHTVQIIYDDGIVSLEEKEIGVLINKIKRHRSDWVIFQYNGYSYNRFGAPNWLSKFYRKIERHTNAKLCMIVHETFIRNEDSFKLKIYRYLQMRTLRITSKYARLIITTTHLYQQQLKDLGRKSEVFFTPSNFENHITEIEKGCTIRNNLRIGTFGNRDPKFLLEVIELLEQKGLVCEFDFIGKYQPQYIKEIKNISKKLKTVKILRSGKLADKGIVDHMKLLDAFILLEHVRPDGGGGLNTKSGASAAAFCLAIPIFSTKGDFTNSKVFKERENYVQVDCNNASLAADVIFKHLENREELVKIGLEGKKMYDRDFCWKRYAENLLDLMDNRV